jgi:AsmA protein
VSRPVKWLVGIVAAVVVLVVAALILVPFLVDTPRVQALIASNASQALGRPVKFRSMSISVLPLPAVALHGLEIAEDPQFGTEPFLKLETGKVRLKLLPLLTGRVELGDVKLTKPVITVIQTADGRMNISTLGTGAGTKESPSEPRAGERAPRGGGGTGGGGAALPAAIAIEHGLVAYVAHGKGGVTSQYRVEDLNLTLTGGAPQLVFKGDLKVKPGDLIVKLADGQVALDGGKPLTEAPLRGAVTLDAKDIGDLAKNALGPTPAFGGALKGKLALSGTLGAPAVAGDIELAKPTVSQLQPSCPEPKRRTLTLGTLKLNAAYRDQVLSARPMTTSLGDGTITGQLSLSLAPGMQVQLTDLAIKGLPLEKALVDYLCQGYAITGPMDLTGATSFSAHDVYHTLSGPGALKIGRGKVVGPRALALLGGIVRVGGAVSSLLSSDVPNLGDSPLEFDSITGTYQIVNGVLNTKDLLYTSRAMKILIAGSYGFATERMDLDMTITHGRGELKAKVTGPASSPSIRVNPATILRDVDRGGQVEKGLGDLLKKIR